MYSLDDKIGEALDVTNRGFTDLPWDVDPMKSTNSDWQK